MKKNITLSVIIPCYNEEENIKRGVLSEIYSYISEKKFWWEVIISDDGSTDSSKSLVKKLSKDYKGWKVLDNPHKGKPLAIYAGLKKAKGEYVLFADMDQSTPISELDKLLPFVGDFEVVIGSRGIERKEFPLYRKMGSAIFMNFRKMMLLPEIKDTQCGFKLFRRSVVLEAFPHLEFLKTSKKAKGWMVTSYDVELLHIIKKLGYKIKEVVVEWLDRDTSTSKGGSLEKYFKESKSMASQIIRVKLNDVRGLYDI
jgi:dolichyl-phosphate beta-glucosyltransferase